MNLSALNTGLNQATANNTPEVNASGNTPLRLPAGTLTGEDFAAFLRNQVRALKNTQRPEFAAETVARPLPQPDRVDRSRPQDDASTSDKQSNKIKTQDKQTARQVKDDDNEAIDRELQNDSKVSNDDLSATDTTSTAQDQADHSAQLNQLQSTTEQDNELTQNLLAEHNATTDEQVLTNTDDLTTIPLSPSINIITATQTAPDDKSLTDFALAMGLDPDQVQVLFGNAGSKTPLQSVSTQQMLSMNALSNVASPAKPLDFLQTTLQLPQQAMTNVAVATADFQAIKAEAPMASDASVGNAAKTLDILNMQVATAAAALNPLAATAPPVSTLAVLSMMDTQLRSEDIEALKNEFDALTALDTGTDIHGLNSSQTNSASNANAPSKAAAAFVNNPDMAQTFDKLSQKLATELAGRMHEKLNAGEWKMKFALKPASLGLVDVQLEMRDGKLTAQFNADTNLTQDLIQNGSQRLKEALGQLGMNNASVLVGQGHSQQHGQSSSQSQPVRHGGDNRVKLEDDLVTEPLVQIRPRHSNSLQFDNYA